MMRFKRSYFFLAAGFLPLLVLLQNPRMREPVHFFSLSLLKPFLVGGHSVVVAASNTREALGHFWMTLRNQTRNEARIAELESKLLTFDELARENERLKKLLDFKRSTPVKSIAAHVIAWNLSPWRKTVVLDKGSRQGLKKDMTVVVERGLVGRMMEVGPTTARVILLIDPDARVSAITEQSRAQGIVSGDGSPFLSMNYLDLDAGVAVGEKVLTSGIGGLFPKGLGIGKIESIAKSADGLHLVARIGPWVPFSKLEEVLCLEFSRAG